MEFCGEVRVNLIKGWDKLLTWTLSPKIKPYLLSSPLIQQQYYLENNPLQSFDQECGFYTLSVPIVGVVTSDRKHIDIANQALVQATQIEDPSLREFAQREILCKVVAYRNLKKGDTITFNGEIYTVDIIIDMWRGMPAYGLIPKHPQRFNPVLLYRGTDMNFISEKGWASILSDLDTSGPGHVTFLKAKNEIQSWLEKINQSGLPAVAYGYSLGGAFVYYTSVYLGALLSQEASSIAFNAPGIPEEVVEGGMGKAPLFSYVNRGDVVSQIGYFIPNLWEVAPSEKMDVIEAHLSLISAKTAFTLNQVDVQRENSVRRKSR